MHIEEVTCLTALVFFFFQTVAGKRRHLSKNESPQNDTIEVGPGNLKMAFSSTSGQLKRIYNSKTGVSCY